MLSTAAAAQFIRQRFPGLSGFFLLTMLTLIVPVTRSAAQDSTAFTADSGTTTFMIMRHAEREGDKDQLSAAGAQRAEILRALGLTLNVDAVYSTNTERTKNTVKPLADELKVELKLYRQVSRDWIEQLQQDHVGEVVLIVGHSNTTGVIAGLLASETPYPIEHDEYDSLFIVSVSESGAASVRLRYGPSSRGAPAAGADKMGEVIKINATR